MKRMRTMLALAGLATLHAACAAPGNSFYILTNGRKEKCKTIEVVNERGDIKIDGRITLRRGSQYRFAYVPRPKEVVALAKAYGAEKYDVAVKAGPKVMQMYKFLGWGDYIAYLEGMSRLELKQYSQALNVFQAGMQFRAKYGDDLVRGAVLAMLELKQTAKVKPMLAKMIKGDDAEDAAFAFNVRGRILAEEGKKKEAVLEHLKSLLLFDAKTAKEQREEARKRVVALLKEMNDPNWQRFEKMQ